MPAIHSLFDPSKDLQRRIEKVIEYGRADEEQLRSEIAEYVVTDHIDRTFAEVLDKMRLAQQGGTGHDIGVWVSGFYGSGKSSFTKYLGYALDRGRRVGQDTFLSLLQARLRTPQTIAAFNQVAQTYDPAVVFLDLASEMLAGAAMAEISTVLYLKVLQWAGYSDDLKISTLERKLEREGRLQAFHERARELLGGTTWVEVQNDPLTANQIAAKLAAEFYPNLYSTPEGFRQIHLDVMRSENLRVEEMLDIIRRKSGKEKIIFVIDEVGQYVSARQNLILNLDGLSRNLKAIGGGKVWLFATAQQTLTEDNPSAMLNAAGLFKLKDRFPIQVHLEASDIKEICHRRLLTKSATGETELAGRYGSNGASLRNATRLHDAGVYEQDLTQKLFQDLYPFLPAQFEILLQLLGRLARKTGGLGLRSAIKVIQDVLVEGAENGCPALAKAPIGTLATTVTFYDSLRRDLSGTFSYIVEGVDRVRERFPNDPRLLDVAKSVAILQILENLPVTAQNVAALLQSDVSSSSCRDEVDASIQALLADSMIPIGEKNGSLRFLTQAAITLQRDFDAIEYRNADVRAQVNEVLRSLFTPLPTARVSGARPVSSGIKIASTGGQTLSLAGDKEPIQLVIELTDHSAYDGLKLTRENDSRATRERATIFLLARSNPEIEALAVTMVRCERFLGDHRSAKDPDTQEFVNIVDERLGRTRVQLENLLTDTLMAGSLVAHGTTRPVSELGDDPLQAARVFLGTAAAQVFDRYAEAPVQAESRVAEVFLKTSVDRITLEQDPLGLIVRHGGQPRVNGQHPGLVSIRDHLGDVGEAPGRELLRHFSEPPFGWSQDTIRYLLAAALVAGDIKLRISGADHQVLSDEAIVALSSKRAIASVGISLRQTRPDPAALDRASTRLIQLTGDERILPLEDDVAKAAKRHFPQYQAAFSPLAVELRSLGLEGTSHPERAQDLADDLAAVISGDGSDAIVRLGAQDSPLYDALLWARQLKQGLDNGLRLTLSHLHRLGQEIEALPNAGRPAQLKSDSVGLLAQAADIIQRAAFFDQAADLRQISNQLDDLVGLTVTSLAEAQNTTASQTLGGWQDSPDWADLEEEDRQWFMDQVAKLVVEAEPSLHGLHAALNHDFTLNSRLRELGESLREQAAEARGKKKSAVKEGESGPALEKAEIRVPKVLTDPEQLDQLIARLEQLRHGLGTARHVRIQWKELD